MDTNTNVKYPTDQVAQKDTMVKETGAVAGEQKDKVTEKVTENTE